MSASVAFDAAVKIMPQDGPQQTFLGIAMPI